MGEDVKNGGAQYDDQDPQIHAIFLKESKSGGPEPRRLMAGI